MPKTFHLKRNDTLPILRVFLSNPDGSVFNGAGFTITARMMKGDVTITRTMTAANEAGGEYTYQWVAADWNTGGLTLGNWDMEYRAVAGINRLTFPNDTFDVLSIKPDIA